MICGFSQIYRYAMSTLPMFPSHYYEPWQRFSTPIVRQLAFAIASPNLIQYFPHQLHAEKSIDVHSCLLWQQYFTAYLPRLIFLDQHPQELLNFLTKIKSTRLGLRFEALLWFWLQDQENQYFELLGHSIQHHANGKTLGEMDFLLRNQQTQHIEHWEVCLKYYLAAPTLELGTWIGLNPEDTLLHKLSHLLDQQFQFDTALNHCIEKRYAVIKGQFYLPVTHAPIPDWLNPQRRLGIWCAHFPKTGRWRHLSRQEWLCPFPCHSDISSNPIWWTNGLYYNQSTEQFLMLRLLPNSFIYHPCYTPNILE